MIEQQEQQQTEQMVPSSSLVKQAIMFTESDGGGKRLSRYWSDGELPYPFGGLESIVAVCSAINLAVMIGGKVYQLQSVSISPLPNMRVH